MGCVNSSAVQLAVEEIDKDFDAELFPKESPTRQFHSDYTLKGKLGKGAFAQVHLAHKVSDGSAVAVKITDLRGQNGDGDEVDQKIRRAVTKEVSILRRVGAQEHCVAFHTYYAEGLLSYVVMQRCDMTLLHAMEKSPELTEDTLVRIFREMLMALRNIHSLRVIHRDVKPDNFLCTGKDLSVQLCDFGLAEVLPSVNSEVKGVYGTAPFMSPEMLAANSYGAVTDVWSLGVIAYVLLFGRFPYQPHETSAKAMKAAVLAGVPAPSFRLKPSLDNGTIHISSKAVHFVYALLDRNKSVRPSAAAALALPWLDQAVDPQQPSPPSLRAVLSSAKRAGAFDTRPVGSNNPNEKPTAVDSLLRGVMKSSSGEKRRHSQRSPSTTSTNDTSASVPLGKANGSSKPDVSMMLSNGALSNNSNFSTATGTASAWSCVSSKQGHHSTTQCGEA